MPTAVRSMLLVDDDDADHFIHRRVIRHVDPEIRVHCEMNVTAAVNHLRSLAESGKALPEIIIMDVNMPGVDGWEFLDRLQAEQSEGCLSGHAMPSLVMLSASTDPDDLERATAHPHVAAFFPKPLTVESLTGLLANAPSSA